MDDDGPQKDDDEGGGGGWLMTFADLMSLLMSFFVLLLSFSEMDVQKYKQVAGSMQSAFGVQREIKADEIPKGTSLVTKEFSPGRPDPDVLINEMRQDTTDETKSTLDFDKESVSVDALELAEMLAKVLDDEMSEGMLDVIVEGGKVRIRVRDKDGYAPGSTEVDAEFKKVLKKITLLLDRSTGLIVVGGHTDSSPTNSFTSNWELSAARASSVIREMMEAGLSDTDRLELRAYSDTRPVATNATVEGRSMNRRMEITVDFDGDPEQDVQSQSEHVYGISGL
jgi:chemotaxis protein MotB